MTRPAAQQCERELDSAELGVSDEDFSEASKLQAVGRHPLMRLLVGWPAAVQWAARRLSPPDARTMGELYDECRRLKAHDLARLVHSDSPSGLELEPVGGPTGSTGKSPTAPIEAWPPRERHAVEKSPSAGKMSEASASSPSGGFGSGGFGSGGSFGD